MTYPNHMTTEMHMSHGRVHRSDDLFQKAQSVAQEPAEAIDQPDVSDSDWAAFDDACGGDQAAYRMVA